LKEPKEFKDHLEKILNLLIYLTDQYKIEEHVIGEGKDKKYKYTLIFKRELIKKQ
jgi:hypothetical protein